MFHKARPVKASKHLLGWWALLVLLYEFQLSSFSTEGDDGWKRKHALVLERDGTFNIIAIVVALLMEGCAFFSLNAYLLN